MELVSYGILAMGMFIGFMIAVFIIGLLSISSEHNVEDYIYEIEYLKRKLKEVEKNNENDI